MATTMKRERLEARISTEQKALLQRAAQLQGRTLTDFVVSSLQEVAEQVIRDHEVMTLTARESALFVEALLNPSPPNERLITAAERYNAMTGVS